VAAAALIAGLAALLALWLLGVWFVYRLRGDRPVPIDVRTQDGWTIRMYHRAPQTRRFLEPVLLCHGLAANHRNLDFEPPWSLAARLAEEGFECFSVDWRGTGGSRRPPKGRHADDYTFDDHVREDAPAFLQAVLSRTGAPRALWVGHSMGGLAGYAVAQGPNAALLGGVVSLGSPAAFAYPPLYAQALSLAGVLAWPRVLRQRLLVFPMAPFLGYANLPLSDIVYNPKHIPPRVLRKVAAQVLGDVSMGLLLQFRDWLEHGAFRSFDKKTDYRAGLSAVSVPLLVCGGASDRLSPPQVVKQVFDLARSEDKTLLLFGREAGDALDYGHGDLIFGAGAPVEVYPRIAAWLKAHATAWEPPR
jgi:pimeloyl-ACP methyl ester carboxylesterase